MQNLLGGCLTVKNWWGLLTVTKYETLLFALIHKHIKNYKGTPKGGFVSCKKNSAYIFTEGKSRSLEQFSCATPVPVAHKIVGKRRIRGELFKDLTC